MAAPDTGARRSASTRRQFLLGGTVAAVGAAGAVGIDYALDRPAHAGATDPLNGDRVVAFHGRHQAGIDTPAQAHAAFLGLDLRPDVTRDDLRRLMRILTDDAARLSRGSAALADSEPELAGVPARLTITFGFGPGLVERAAGAPPPWLRPLPAFSIDRLEPRWSGGDLLLQVAADDPLTVAHASRMLLKDARSFTALRWVQHGFRNAHGSVAPGTTMRNLFGQVDGTTNPIPATEDFDRVVWATDGWWAGGTGVVIRRTAMDLDTWDRLDRSGREQSVGRRLDTGAPLTGEKRTRRTRLRRHHRDRISHDSGVLSRSPSPFRQRDPTNFPARLQLRPTTDRWRGVGFGVDLRIVPGRYRRAVRADSATARRTRPAQRMDHPHRFGRIRRASRMLRGRLLRGDAVGLTVNGVAGSTVSGVAGLTMNATVVGREIARNNQTA